MRGQVLGYDNGQGVINGDDGLRYTFTAADWKGTASATAGAGVDFVGAAGVARDVYPTASAGFAGASAGAGLGGAMAPRGPASDGSLAGRAKGILLNPLVEWQAIAAQPMTVKQIMTYAAIVSGIGYGIAAVVGVVLNLLTLFSRYGSFAGVVGAVLGPLLMWAAGLGVVYVMGMIAAALAPTFKGRHDNLQGLKLVVFAATGFWVANFLYVVPLLNWLAMVAGALYSAYLIYLGSKPVMQLPEDSGVVYALLVAGIWWVFSIITYVVVTAIVVSIALAGAAVGSPGARYYGF